MGRMVACVEDSSTGMEGKPLWLPNPGLSSHKCVKRALITLLPVHRRQTPRRALGLSSKAILQLGRCERRLFCRRHYFNPAGIFFTPWKMCSSSYAAYHFSWPPRRYHRSNLLYPGRKKSKSSLRFERACYQVNLSPLMSCSTFRENAYP